MKTHEELVMRVLSSKKNRRLQSKVGGIKTQKPPTQTKEVIKNATQAIGKVLDTFSSMISQPRNGELASKISVHTKEGIRLIRISNIICCKASGNYTQIYLKDGSSPIASFALGNFANELDDNSFFRTHKSWLINLMEVKYLRVKTRELIAHSGETISVSRSKMIEIKQLLGLS